MKCPKCGLNIPDCLHPKTIEAIKERMSQIESDLIFYEDQRIKPMSYRERVALGNCETISKIHLEMLNWVLNKDKVFIANFGNNDT